MEGDARAARPAVKGLAAAQRPRRRGYGSRVRLSSWVALRAQRGWQSPWPSLVPASAHARTDRLGSVLPPALLSDYPIVAFGGNLNTLVVWEVTDGGEWLVQAERFDSNAQPLDDGGFLVTISNDDFVAPTVTSNGRDFLVVWQTQFFGSSGTATAMWGARVSGSGAVLDPGGFSIGTVDGAENPSAERRLGRCRLARCGGWAVQGTPRCWARESAPTVAPWTFHPWC